MYARRNSKGGVELIKVNYMSYETIASEGAVNGVIVEHYYLILILIMIERHKYLNLCFLNNIDSLQ